MSRVIKVLDKKSATLSHVQVGDSNFQFSPLKWRLDKMPQVGLLPLNTGLSQCANR